MSTTQSTNPASLDTPEDLRLDLAAQRSVCEHASWHRLLGKEARQLAPLLFAMVGCGVVLHLLGLLAAKSLPNNFHETILALIPVLFAVGAGPMQVSQEKEQRTLDWLASLPIRPRSIVLSKLIVSLLGLIVCWLISLGMTFAIQPSVFGMQQWNGLEWMFWPVSTLLLQSMGFALAWILPSAGSTLIAMLLSASSAFILSALIQNALNSGHNNSEFLGWLCFHYVVFAGVLSWAAIRYGKNSFVAGATGVQNFTWFRWRERSNLVRDRTHVPTQSPASSLIWQIGKQNHMLWAGLSLIVLMGIVSLCYALRLLKSPELLAVTPVLGLVVFSWLGASVFGSDSHRGRIRFLAERGVSPFRIWWTRLALPMGCSVLGLLVFFLMNETWVLAQNNYRVPPHMPSTLRGPVTIGVLMMFAFTQWMSQWTRSTLIVFCISPVVAIFAFIYVAFLIEYLNALWWLLAATMGVSLVATRVMLCPWMDGRFGWRYWLSHGGMLVGALVIPLIPFLTTYATYPDMPSALQRELAIEAKQYGPPARETELVNAANRNDHSNSKTSIESSSFSDSVSKSTIALEHELSTASGPIRISRPMTDLIKEVQLMSLRMDSGEIDSVDRQQQYRERYQRSIVLISNLVVHLRLSDRLLDQEYADRIECGLVSELVRSGRRELFAEEEFSKMVTTLADQTARRQARRRAVVMTWNQFVQGHVKGDFGGLDLPTIPTSSFATSWLVADRNVGLATAELLKYLETKRAEPNRFPAEIQSFWRTGVTGDDWQLSGFDLYSIKAPGTLWHRDWETKAEQLNESLK